MIIIENRAMTYFVRHCDFVEGGWPAASTPQDQSGNSSARSDSSHSSSKYLLNLAGNLLAISKVK